MTNSLFNPNQLTLNIVLATIPQGKEKEFDDDIKEKYFVNFRKKSSDFCAQEDPTHIFCDDDSSDDISKKTPVLYNPIRYYILGNYDIAYISLIDNLKFAQKLFESVPLTPSEPVNLFSPHTFQSFTGINYYDRTDLKNFFYKHLSPSGKKKFFLGICNLKLNNGFSIGNGNRFLKAVFDIIELKIKEFNEVNRGSKKVEFLLLQSFSWFEVSLLIFTDHPTSITEILRIIRGVSAQDLAGADEIVAASLYRDLLTDIDNSDLIKANIFADTHTYIGIHGDLIDSTSQEDKFVNDFLSKAHKLRLPTQIEWQVKPGHMHLLANYLQDDIDGRKIGFKFNFRYLLTGKTDYVLQKSSQNILTNFHLMKLILRKDGKLFNHVRKVRTKIISKAKIKQHREIDRKGFSLNEPLKKLIIAGAEIKTIDEALKALKISRQIKSKILKIFSNYNNGIQDIILFPFFLDFTIFIEELKNFITEEHTRWKQACLIDSKEFFEQTYQNLVNHKIEMDIQSVNEIEDKLVKRILVFEEGYSLRMLNCYQFEDITDFDLDFNSSVQQLLSAYSSLITELGALFYDNKKKYQFGPIVQLNLEDTKGNYNSINYHVLHLISPEFIFATITKEILNYEEYDAEEFKTMLSKYYDELNGLKNEHPYLDEMINEGIIDFTYFINDALRFIITYDLDFDLFYHWFWTYNLQNSMLYDKRGLMNESHFKKELIRIILIAKLFKIPMSKLTCPVPELFTYWERHYNSLSQMADDYLAFLNSKSLLRSLTEYLQIRFELYLKILIPESGMTKYIPHNDIGNLDIFLDMLAEYEGLVFEDKNRYYYLIQLINQFSTNIDKPEQVSLAYLHCHMVSYLRKIYEHNQPISFLRRDWATGLPLQSFIKAKTTSQLYSVDQTGGVFFDDMQQLSKYFKYNSEVLCSILHYSMVLKKSFIKSKINERTP